MKTAGDESSMDECLRRLCAGQEALRRGEDVLHADLADLHACLAELASAPELVTSHLVTCKLKLPLKPPG